MANALRGSVYILDTAGTIVTDKPIWISKIVLEPALATDAAELKFWIPGTQYAELSGTYNSGAILGTITSNTTLTMASGTLLPNTVLDGDVFKITRSNGSNAPSTNVVTTAGNGTVVVCANSAWTNESTMWYNFESYPTRSFCKLYSSTLDVDERDFDGFLLPNLTLETLSTNAKVKIYIL